MRTALWIISVCCLLLSCATTGTVQESDKSKIIGAWVSKNGSFISNDEISFDHCRFFESGKFECLNYAPRSDVGLESSGTWQYTEGAFQLFFGGTGLTAALARNSPASIVSVSTSRLVVRGLSGKSYTYVREPL